MSVDVIIPAGGAGKRMGGASSKQFMDLDGTPILARSLGVFNRMEEINRIVLVVPQDEIEFVKKAIVDRYHLSRVWQVLAGGQERQDSVKNGIFALGPQAASDDIVVIHDAVRPFVTEELILKSIDECRRYGAVTLGVPVKDTVKRVDTQGVVENTVDRAVFWLTQTPQTFKKSIIMEAYGRAGEEGFRGTDDASLVERIGVGVRMIFGSYENIKITTPEDMEYGEFILRKRKEAIK
jgi:2-C-methyl-D-erythritol 4-phosphate cytidylyltransferase